MNVDWLLCSVSPTDNTPPLLAIRNLLKLTSSLEKRSKQSVIISWMKQFLLYLDELCDDALGNTSDSLSSQMMPHQVSHRSDPAGGNGDLEEKQNHNICC